MGLHHLPGGKVRHADLPDLSKVLQFGKGAERVFQRGVRIPAVDIQQVNAVPVQPLARTVKLADYIAPPRSAEIGDLGGDMQIVPAMGKLAQKCFGHPFGIPAGRIKIDDPGGKTGVKHRAGGGGIGLAAPLHGPECQ